MSSRNTMRSPCEPATTAIVMVDLVHGERKMLGLPSRLDRTGVLQVGLKDLHIQVEAWLFGGNLSVVATNHCRLTTST